MTNVTEDDLSKALYDASLLELLDEKGYTPAPLRPKGFGITVREFASNKKITTKVAGCLLAKAVEDGLLVKTSMRVRGSGAPSDVFHRKEKAPS